MKEIGFASIRSVATSTLHAGPAAIVVVKRLLLANKRTLEVARNNCLRICLDLPKGSSASGTVAEAGCLPLNVIASQETMSTHLWHVLQGKEQYRVHITHKKLDLASKRQLGHEIGKAAAEKSRGLFSADDWQCGRCGNVNWARRQSCNMCNAPKFGEVEERTGLGGGYNERENVEYVDREESDSEYDDFGRRKKRARRDDDRAASPLSRQSEREDEEKENDDNDKEEEEEEDEDGGGDLSKYDLSGWDSPHSPGSSGKPEEEQLQEEKAAAGGASRSRDIRD
ncbi:zinc finger Ran-binding domain-containing protein 2 isoform X2 [Dermacentor albipictus]|uniref:zinc finger Ran-binding domain-containing protein 2 isoform X2 n=1 Tax=Dermacentor albipictus TaxID=60249 RepID=UPI0031FC2844